jgi:hypothetical protein
VVVAGANVYATVARVGRTSRPVAHGSVAIAAVPATVPPTPPVFPEPSARIASGFAGVATRSKQWSVVPLPGTLALGKNGHRVDAFRATRVEGAVIDACVGEGASS